MIFRRIADKISSDTVQNGLNSFLNPFSYLVIRKTPQLIENIDCFCIDGQLLVKLLSVFASIKVARRSFDMTSLAPIVLQNAVDKDRSVYLIGSDEESINGAVEKFKIRFSGLNICGFRNGFLRTNDERANAISKIINLSPDIVIVGMGTPRQEQFLVDLKTAGFKGTGYTCGGFFHQTARKIDYYPQWADKYHLRWLYRITDEPKLLKRYTIDYSIFIFVFLWDVFMFQFSHLNKSKHKK